MSSGPRPAQGLRNRDGHPDLGLAAPGWLRPRDHAATPWANGRGTTRELARGDFWRLSIAELTEDAPFSPFPGMDRLFLLVNGQVILRVDGEVTEMTAGDVLIFPGEAEVAVVVDHPAQAVNLMVHRDALRCESRSGVDVLELAPAHHEFVVLASPGRTAEGDDLEPGSVWMADPAPSILRFAQPVTVHRVRLRPHPERVGD